MLRPFCCGRVGLEAGSIVLSVSVPSIALPCPASSCDLLSDHCSLCPTLLSPCQILPPPSLLTMTAALHAVLVRIVNARAKIAGGSTATVPASASVEDITAGQSTHCRAERPSPHSTAEPSKRYTGCNSDQQMTEEDSCRLWMQRQANSAWLPTAASDSCLMLTVPLCVLPALCPVGVSVQPSSLRPPRSPPVAPPLHWKRL